MLSKKKTVRVTAENLADYLSVPKYRYGEIEDADQIGVVTGPCLDRGGRRVADH